MAKSEQLILISTLTQEMAIGEEGEFSKEDQKELQRRIDAVASGRVNIESWESVRAEWRAKYGA
ncbi:MAG: addiction module protein [Bacteroidota bacterium]